MRFVDALAEIKSGMRVSHRDWEDSNSFLVMRDGVIYGVYPDREVIWQPTQAEVLSDDWKFYGVD